MRRTRVRPELHRTPATQEELDRFANEVRAHDEVERRLLRVELSTILVVAAFVVARQLWWD